jgi:hypothetical protein
MMSPDRSGTEVHAAPDRGATSAWIKPRLPDANSPRPLPCRFLRTLCTFIVLLQIAPCSLAVASEPVLKTRFMVRDGYVAVDPAATTLDLGARASDYENCGLSPGAMQSELVAYLDDVLKRRGKILDQLALTPVNEPLAADALARRAATERALRELAGTDAATAKLYALSASWIEGEAAFRAWTTAHARATPAVTQGIRNFLVDVYGPIFSEPKWADGPLLPPADFYNPEDFAAARNGEAAFELAPPFSGDPGKLRPSMNIAEWDTHRRELAEDLLAPFGCKLWYREPIVERVQDYLAMRGISVQPYRTPRDVRDAHDLVPFKMPPTDMAGIAPERPSFARADLGGRVLLDPDPLIENLYIELDVAREWDTLRRVLYLLLPTRDWQEVLAAPTTYLCRMEAVWKPSSDGAGRPEVVRLDLATGEGAQLALARTYLTRRAVAERLQRLDTVGFVSRLDFPVSRRQHKAVSLLVERQQQSSQPPAAATAGPAIPACSDSAPVPAREKVPPAPLSAGEHEDIVKPNRTGARSGSARESPRNNLVAGIERDAGKPVRYSAGYSRTGLADDDTFSVQIGQQAKSSGEVKYSRDFLGFGGLDRRVQLAVRAFSEFIPDRALPAAAADERRTGADIHGTIDIWRDRAGSFAQVDLGAAQHEAALDGAIGAPAKTRVTLLDLAFSVVKSWDGSPASEHVEFGTTVGRGHASDPGGAFTKLGVDFAYQRFLGAFTRWDLRMNGRYIGGEAPSTEWPVFGGEDSVRGYRADTAIARSAWVVQNEYWMPLSGLAGGNAALARTLRRSVALALFADIGGLQRTAGPVSGRKFGVGAGLRYNLSDSLVLRLDWARAVHEDPAVASRSGQLYLSVSSRRTL